VRLWRDPAPRVLYNEGMGLGSTRRTVLVTGAAGFLGSHLVDRLLAEGFEVVGLDNLMTGDLGNLEAAGRDRHFHLEIGDVRENLHAYAEVIFNLACPASPEHYQADPYATLTTSVLGALRIAEHARLRRVRVVQASTSEVYGDPLEHPQKEEYWGNVNPVGHRACYDEGKRAAETIMMDARRCHGADVRVARIFNTYGPRMALNDGRVVSNFVRQAILGEPLTVYGEGEQSRSFCYVSDLVDGLLRLGVSAQDLSGLKMPIVNLGNPAEITMLELVGAIEAYAGKKLDVVHRPLPEDDPRRRCPDITVARLFLGFEPKVSLAHGIAETYQNFRERIARGRRAETGQPSPYSAGSSTSG
jgi:UDP-glucuronate decarboxylase